MSRRRRVAGTGARTVDGHVGGFRASNQHVRDSDFDGDGERAGVL